MAGDGERRHGPEIAWVGRILFASKTVYRIDTPSCFTVAVSMTVGVFTLVALLTRVKARFFCPSPETKNPL
jgi:hypothetical protein